MSNEGVGKILFKIRTNSIVYILFTMSALLVLCMNGCVITEHIFRRFNQTLVIQF